MASRIFPSENPPCVWKARSCVREGSENLFNMGFELRDLISDHVWNTECAELKQLPAGHWLCLNSLRVSEMVANTWRDWLSTLNGFYPMSTKSWDFSSPPGSTAWRFCCFLGQPLWEFCMNYRILLWGRNCDYRFNDALNKQKCNDFHQCKTGASCRETTINVTSRQGCRPGWQPAVIGTPHRPCVLT